jgi:hypothetical protein
MTSVHADLAIAVVAHRQRGVFSRAQALGAGLSSRAIETRVASRRWSTLAASVYALPQYPGTWERNLMAAILGEPEAVAGGKSAAVLHQIAGFRPGRPEIVVATHAQNRSPLALVRRRDDVRTTEVDGMPTLTVVDTIFAIAGIVKPGRVATALDDVLARRIVGVEQIQQRYLELAIRRRRGLPTLRRLIELRSPDHQVPPESVLEGRLYDLLDRPGMPPHRRQAAMPWAPHERVDAVLVHHPVIIEADGRRWHTRVADFERDRQRDRAAALHGYRTIRYTYDDLFRHADQVEIEIRAVIQAAA